MFLADNLKSIDDTSSSTFEWQVEKTPVAYERSLAFMEARVRTMRERSAPEMVRLLEHPPVYTAGTVQIQKIYLIIVSCASQGRGTNTLCPVSVSQSDALKSGRFLIWIFKMVSTPQLIRQVKASHGDAHGPRTHSLGLPCTRSKTIIKPGTGPNGQA